MADNTLLNVGTGGDTIRDLARQSGTVKTQVVQLDFGGASANAEQLVSTTNALPAAMYDGTNLAINSLSAGTGANGLLVAQGATNFFFSAVNSSTAQLAAAATFNGGIEAVLSSPEVSVIIDSDQPGTLVVKQYITSTAGTQVINTTFNITAKASGNCFGRSFPINGNYFSVSFTNTGASATTTLNINVAYGNIPAVTQLLNAPMSLNEVNGTAFTLGQAAMATSLPVVLASNQASIPVAATLQAGSAVAGKFGIDQTTPGTTNLVALTAETTKVIGTVNLSAAQTLATVTTVGAVTAITNALPTGANTIGTVNPPAITKGTQGTVGVSTQDLKDAGRNQTNYFMAAQVVSTATDALQSLTGYKSGAAVTATTTPAVVTTAKTYRINKIVITYIAIATIGAIQVSLRANTAGVVAITSPLVDSWIVGTSAATAGVTTTTVIDVPDGIEFAAGTGIGISVLGLGATGTATAVGYAKISVSGYEY
jgi:hypothetical protein